MVENKKDSLKQGHLLRYVYFVWTEKNNDEKYRKEFLKYEKNEKRTPF